MHRIHRSPLALTALALLAAAPALHAQRLVAIGSNRAIYEIDPATGVKTQIGTASSNASTTAGLAYDFTTSTIYLTSTGNDSLYTLDLATGTATLVGAYGNSSLVMHGLEYDVVSNTLWGASSHDAGIYSIDRATGAATLVGLTGLSSFVNLAHDLVGNVLYATNSGADSFYTIDRATGAATLVGPLNGPTNPNSLAFLPGTQTLYMIDNSQGNLYTIDLATGAATLIGSVSGGNILGLVWLPGSITREAHACGTATIETAGNATLGASIVTTLGGISGAPFIGYGFGPSTPFCTCTLGHSWSAASFGATSTLNVPQNPSLVGASIKVQGADLFGSSGGCVAPQVAFTDTFTITIG